MSRHQAVVPASSHRIFGPGQVCLDAEEGDLVLVRGAGFAARAIRAFERLRVPREYAWCNHACVVLNRGPNAHVAQETARGVVLTPLAELGAETFAVVRFHASADQLGEAVAFATWSLGLGYGFLSIPADALNALTGLELGLVVGNRMVCSTQACRAMERLGLIPDRSPYAVTPAHLARYADVTLPTPLMAALAGA